MVRGGTGGWHGLGTCFAGGGGTQTQGNVRTSCNKPTANPTAGMSHLQLRLKPLAHIKIISAVASSAPAGRAGE